VICFLPLKGLNPGEIDFELESVYTRTYSPFQRYPSSTRPFETGEPSFWMIQCLRDPVKVVWPKQFRQYYKNVHLHQGGFLLDISVLLRRRASEFCTTTWDFKSSSFDGSHTLVMLRGSEIVSDFPASFWRSCTENIKTILNIQRPGMSSGFSFITQMNQSGQSLEIKFQRD
jgi:hypothetical protein